MSIRMISVYPGEAVEEVLGWGSSRFNIALQLLASILRKQIDLAVLLHDEERQQLADILGEFEMKGATVGVLKQVEQIARLRGHKKLLKALAATGIGDLAIWKFWFGRKAAARENDDDETKEA